MLDDFGLIKTIERHVTEFYSKTALETEFIVKGSPREPSRSTSIYLLRVIKELLNNSLKHAEADKVVVTVYGSDTMFGASVADNGKGFDSKNIFKSPHNLKGITVLEVKKEEMPKEAPVKKKRRRRRVRD